MYKLSKGNLKCHFVIWKPRSCTLAFSMQYMCIYSSKPKNYSYMCQTLYLNSWLQPSYPKYEIHFKMLQSKSWGLTYIHVTHFLVHVYIYIWQSRSLTYHFNYGIEQLWVKYSIRKQTETVSDSNKGVIVDRKIYHISMLTCNIHVYVHINNCSFIMLKFFYM